jgi:hypothetical protein
MLNKKCMNIKYDIKELLIHKKTKSLIQVTLCLINDKPIAIVHETTDGINIGNQVVDASYLISFPELTGNFVLDMKAVLKHFRAHGFKTISIITSTKKGIKFS